jgi:hypothetical protein
VRLCHFLLQLFFVENLLKAFPVLFPDLFSPLITIPLLLLLLLLLNYTDFRLMKSVSSTLIQEVVFPYFSDNFYFFCQLVHTTVPTS